MGLNNNVLMINPVVPKKCSVGIPIGPFAEHPRKNMKSNLPTRERGIFQLFVQSSCSPLRPDNEIGRASLPKACLWHKGDSF